MKYMLAGLLGAAGTLGAAQADEWGYEGAGAPENWGQLAPEYAVCSAGTQQSPIDLTQALPSDGVKPVLSFGEISGFEAERNAHGVTYHMPSGAAQLELNGDTYDLLQFHFHAASEHHVDGASFPLEVHFVTSNGTGLAVVGVLFETGAANATVDALWSAIGEPGERQSIDTSLDLTSLLPADQTAYRYEGSLTTPPCSEIVSWTVFTSPLTVSQEQVDAFVSLVGENARPPQPLNRRYVLLDD
ncbi:carbonic anhydrase [Maricaulis parjimensis]|uniref:carbonic anhydrase n=1 Tax=Maricaulis parjimensis TaxID=144023 RepID=UPI001EEED741|nr:carbonic anhydrase family protein [Maricaulis parjimensis]